MAKTKRITLQWGRRGFRPTRKVVTMAKAKQLIKVDTMFRNEGSVWLVRPISEAAVNWCNQYIDPDAQRWGDAYVVEPRYVEHLAEGMKAEELTCGWA